MDDSTSLLDTRLMEELEKYPSLSDEEKKEAIVRIEKLCKLKYEGERLVAEFNDRYDARIMNEKEHDRDRSLKEKQRKDAYILACITAGTTLLTTTIGHAVYARLAKMFMVFEKDNIISGSTFRSFMNKLSPRK